MSDSKWKPDVIIYDENPDQKHLENIGKKKKGKKKLQAITDIYNRYFNNKKKGGS